MAFTEVLTGASITVEQFSSQVFEEFTKMLWWKNLMGTDPDMRFFHQSILVEKPHGHRPGHAHQRQRGTKQGAGRCDYHPTGRSTPGRHRDGKLTRYWERRQG